MSQFITPPAGRGWGDVPDKLPLITTGNYKAIISFASVELNKRRDGNNLVIKYKIAEPGNPNDGRTVTQYLGLNFESRTPGEESLNAVRIRRLFNTFGIKPTDNGYGYGDLIGRSCRIDIVVAATTTSTGGTIEVNNVKDVYPI